MGTINKMIATVTLVIFAGIGISIYMTNYLATNVSGWSPILTGMVGQYWPLLLGLGVLVTIIFSSIAQSRKG
jgi:hypothetical protein